MVSRVTLPDARIPIGHAVVNGMPVDVAIDIEWMRAFVGLLTRGGGTSAPSTPDVLALVNRMGGAGGREGDQGDPGIPGPPGMAGPMGPQGYSIPGQPGEDGDQGFPVPGPRGETGAAGGPLDSGTSFPGAPSTDDIFYRTDRALLYYYDGTRWLTVDLYLIPLAPFTALPTGRSVNTTGLLAAYPSMLPDYDFWMIEMRWTSYVATTNNGTNYWSAVLAKVDNPDTATTIVTGTTASDSADGYVPHTTAIGALLGTTAEYLRFSITKTLSPGTIDLPCATVVGRLVG